MADQKGSSSNPAKGLVSHLDRNRSLQQDRIVGTSSSPSTSFRSQPHNHSAAPAEANFANFSAAPQLGALPLRPANQQPTQFQPGLGRTWLHEFNLSREREVQDPAIMSSYMRRAVQGAANQNAAQQNAAQQNAANHGTFNQGLGPQGTAYHGITTLNGMAWYQPPQLPPHLNTPGFVQGGVLYNPGPVGQSQQPTGNHTGATAVSDQYDVYPEQVLADNPGMAMEAAFAAYDDDFQNEMDNWMGAHGPADREVIKKMEEVLAADKQRDELHLDSPIIGRTDLGPSINPAVPGSNIESYEYEKKHFDPTVMVEESRSEAREEVALNNSIASDAEMREHAVKILDMLATSGSAETKKKLASSSFRGLMEAIASGKAVVFEERFIDSTSGAMIHDWEALGDSNIPNGKNKAQSETVGKGKGKMKTLEEQAKEDEAKYGGAPAPA